MDKMLIVDNILLLLEEGEMEEETEVQLEVQHIKDDQYIVILLLKYHYFYCTKIQYKFILICINIKVK